MKSTQPTQVCFFEEEPDIGDEKIINCTPDTATPAKTMMYARMLTIIAPCVALFGLYPATVNAWDYGGGRTAVSRGPVEAQQRGACGAEAVTITVGGLERCYTLYVPNGRHGGPMPLVIVLHGTGGAGNVIQRFVGIDQYADRMRFAVAYPDAVRPDSAGRKAHWNAALQQAPDDVAFLRALVEDVAGRVPLDSRRIYATGFSSGGMMVYRLACDAADLFAAIAPVAANIPAPILNNCRPKTPLSVLAINGEADFIMPMAGGALCGGQQTEACNGGRVASLDDSLAVFARLAGCGGAPTSTMLPLRLQDGTSVEHRVYPSCAGGTMVAAYVVHGGGHVWPPVPPREAMSGVSSKNLDATQMIVEFFMAHNR